MRVVPVGRRVLRVVVVIALVVSAASILVVRATQSAEPALTSLEAAVGCAPPPSIEVPATALRVAGAQDTLPRMLFEPRDTVVIGGGTQNGVALGQKYYVRRPIFASGDYRRARGIHTLGWVTVVAVNDTTAIASLDHFCDGIMIGDYLEPYARPVIPAGAEKDEVSGDLDFTALGRVLSGTDDHRTVAIGHLLLIDRGEDQGVQPGARFAIYRDQLKPGVPLTSVGEGVVLSIGKSMALARVTRSRDAVVAGDYVVPRK
jgi:hypothetical protein